MKKIKLYAIATLSIMLIAITSCTKSENEIVPPIADKDTVVVTPTDPVLPPVLKLSYTFYEPVPWQHSTFKSTKSANDTLKITELPDYLKLGLAAYYPFNDSTKDESGNGLNGKVIKEDISENPTVYLFNSSQDSTFIKVNDNASLDFSTTFTLAVWYANNTTSPIIQGIVGKARDNYNLSEEAEGTRISGFGSAYSLTLANGYYNENDNITSVTLRFGVNDGGSNDVCDYSNETISDGNWHFVVATFGTDSLGVSTMKLYYDGELVKEKTTSVLPQQTSQPLYIGRDSRVVSDDVDALRYFYGGIDNVMLYNREISAAEVTALYKLRVK